MEITLPDSSLVVLIGPSGAGKSTFAATQFRPTEVVSSDECRALVSDSESNLAATPAAFRVLHSIARERLRAGRMTVIDATSVLAASRKLLVAVAREHARPVVAIVFDVPLETCIELNQRRNGRRVPAGVITKQHEQMARSMRSLSAEGFDHVFVLRSADEVAGTTIVRRLAAAGLASPTESRP